MWDSIGTVFGASFERAPWGWAVLAAIIGGYFKLKPLMVKLANERETSALAARAEDMDDMRKRIADLETKVETASTAAHAAEMKLVYAVSAIQLLAAQVRMINPDDPALAQAMELLKAATTGAMPPWSSKLADNLSQMKGTGE